MKEKIIEILKSYSDVHYLAEIERTANVIGEHSFEDIADKIISVTEVAEMPTERKYTAKDVDMAYIIGAFNSAKLDGLGDELKRLKELKKLPHEIVDEIRNRMSKPNTGGEK